MTFFGRPNVNKLFTFCLKVFDNCGSFNQLVGTAAREVEALATILLKRPVSGTIQPVRAQFLERRTRFDKAPLDDALLLPTGSASIDKTKVEINLCNI